MEKKQIDPTRTRPPTSVGDLRCVIPDYYCRGDVVVMEVLEAIAANFNVGCVVKYLARAGHKVGELASEALTKARHALWRELRLQRGGTSESGWEGATFALCASMSAARLVEAWKLGKHEGLAILALFEMDFRACDEHLQRALVGALQSEGRSDG